MQFKMYPEVILVIERPGKDVYILMVELKIKIYRIISKQDTNKIKILSKDSDNKEKFLKNRRKIEEEGYEIKTKDTIQNQKRWRRNHKAIRKEPRKPKNTCNYIYFKRQPEEKNNKIGN